MDILCLGQQNWDHCWTGKQQLTSRLAERGHRVLYVDPDFPAIAEDHAVRAASAAGIPGLRQRGRGDLWTYTYLPKRSLGWKINKHRQPRMLSSILRAVGFHAPVALCLHPNQLENLTRANPQAVVYYAVDEYTAYEGMTEEACRSVRSRENRILREAEVALAVSEGLRERFAKSNPASYVLENGSDVDHYRPEKLMRIAPALADLDGPVIGFIGQVDSRVDQELIAELAEQRPDWQFIFAGRRTEIDFSRLESKRNVRLLGYQPYEVLPSLGKQVDVWIVPYVESELTHACNPLKVYEYLATGKPVVSRPLRGLAVCRDVVRLAREPVAFLSAIDAALADPQAGRSERLRRAEDNDWYVRVEALERYLEEAVRRSRESGRWVDAVTPLARAGGAAPSLDSATFVDEYGEPRGRPAKDLRRWRTAIAISRAVGLPGWIRPVAGRLFGGNSGGRPRRILVPWFGHLGDFIALSPMLAHLRRCFPGAKVVLGVHRGSIAAQLFARSPDVDEVLAIDFVPWRADISWRERFKRYFALLGRRFDLVIAGSHWFVMEEGQLAGSPRYVALRDGHPLQDMQGRFLRRDFARHEADNDLALAEAVAGKIARGAERQPRLSFDETEVAKRREAIVDELPISHGAPVLLVHPGSKLPSRRWPGERLAETVVRVMKQVPDLTVVLTGTAGERPIVEDVKAQIPSELMARVRDAVGRTDMTSLAGLMDRANGVLSNDTGIMHFARARGTPLVAVLGPENHKLWGPHPFGDAPAYAIRREVPCAPCRLHSCEPHYCVKSISVDVVEQAVLKMLADGRVSREGESTLHLDVERLSWSMLKRNGFELPLVSVIVQDNGDGAMAAVFPFIENQTYPNLEIIHVQRREGERWSDRRGEDRRHALPISVVEEQNGEPDWRQAINAARGDFLVRASPGDAWRPTRVALDVAAATRTTAQCGFVDGRPVPDFQSRPEALVRRTMAGALANAQAGEVMHKAFAPAPGPLRATLFRSADAPEVRSVEDGAPPRASRLAKLPDALVKE